MQHTQGTVDHFLSHRSDYGGYNSEHLRTRPNRPHAAAPPAKLTHSTPAQSPAFQKPTLISLCVAAGTAAASPADAEERAAAAETAPESGVFLPEQTRESEDAPGARHPAGPFAGCSDTAGHLERLPSGAGVGSARRRRRCRYPRRTRRFPRPRVLSSTSGLRWP